MLAKFFPAVPMADQAEGFLKNVELGHDPAGHVSREEPQLAAFAARVFKDNFRRAPLDDDGLYWVTLDSHRTPVFLSSMLSGARPLDSHSMERLVWHMRKTLKQM